MLKVSFKVVVFLLETLNSRHFFPFFCSSVNFSKIFFYWNVRLFKLNLNLEIVTFSSDKSEKDKILILFTICFLHFYTNFSYENNFKFEDFYTQDLVNLCTKFKVLIVDIKQFKIFCYSFYEQIIKEINKIDYNRLKLLYSFYNPDSLNNENLIMDNNQSKNILEVCKFFFMKLNPNLSGTCFNYYKLQNLVNNKFFKPLISTTERVVDMVLSVNNCLFF